MPRKKHKGDTYLACHSYEKALEEYEKVFESDEILHAEKEAYGSIFHNMGVAYSNLAEFRKAAEYFLKMHMNRTRRMLLCHRDFLPCV